MEWREVAGVMDDATKREGVEDEQEEAMQQSLGGAMLQSKA